MFQQLEGMGKQVWGQNTIQIQENSIQINIYGVRLKQSLNKNFVVSLTAKILTEGKFWFLNFTKKNAQINPTKDNLNSSKYNI